MNWKRYKSFEASVKRNEAYYIIGLDIGNDSSAIAFYNLADYAPESIDLSGGYGKPSIPTVMQYISETKEWVFGEYAVLNSGTGVTFLGLTERLGRFDYVDVAGRSFSVAAVLAMFLKEILGNVKSINPKAEIVGIVAAVPAYFNESAREEFLRAFKLAGYEKELIALVPDRECILAHYYRQLPDKEEHTLILDFGNRELRGGLYEIKPEGGGIVAVSLSSLFDDMVSMGAVNRDVTKLFESFIGDSTDAKQHIPAFTHQHKDMLFQKNIRSKPVKLYFNFAYPPTQHTLTSGEADMLIKPYAGRFNRFIRDVTEKNLRKIPVSKIDVVICVGGGFDMLWARDAVCNVFSKDRVRFGKNPKLTIAEGAAVIAARMLEVEGINLTLEDNHQLKADIGFADGENFLTLVERNGFWWQKHPAKLLLINEAVAGDVNLQLARRNAEGEGRILTTVKLDGLPERPKGVTRLEANVEFYSDEEFIVTMRDVGFGELFPKVEYVREFTVRV